MKRNVIKLTAATLLLVSLGACKKSNDSKSKTQLLTQSSWKTTNQEFGSGTNWVQNPDWTNAEACEKDNLIIFKSDLSWEENEGASKCDPADNQVIDNGSWAWQENETKIVIAGKTGTVNQLDENTLQIIAPISGNTSLRVTYSH